jgi:hypothetical protein
MRRASLGALAALVVYFVLAAVGAAVVTAGTGTVDGRATAWELACAVAGLLAGFAGARVAVASARPLRYLAAVAGPALLALLFALTTDARDETGLWVALLATVLGAALGAGLRDAAGAAQRRRA